MAGPPTPPPGTGRWAVVAVALAFLLVGAGVLLTKRPAPVPVKVSPEPPAQPEQPLDYLLARADAARGEAQFTRCAGCHQIEQGAPNGVGPNLWGVMGARVASRPGHSNFSQALRDHGGTWTWQRTNAFLRSPRTEVPGTRMTFGGLLDAQQRADLLVFLNSRGGSLTLPGPGATFDGPAPAAGVTREFLTGSWSSGSCDVPSATYAADGTTDGGRRRWQLDGDRLIVSRGAEREQSAVERLGDDRIRLNTAAGPFELSRCPAR
jgi:cytochrome c2